MSRRRWRIRKRKVRRRRGDVVEDSTEELVVKEGRRRIRRRGRRRIRREDVEEDAEEDVEEKQVAGSTS